MDNRARKYAASIHAAQTYGPGLHLDHLDETVAVLEGYGYTEPKLRAAGFLHDTVEDGPDPEAIKAHIEAEFGPDVLFMVKFCSDQKTDPDGRPYPNRKERKKATYTAVRRMIDEIQRRGPDVDKPELELLWDAIRVKVADRIANLRACYRTKSALLNMYRKEAVSFRDALFVPGVCDEMWEEYTKSLDQNRA